MQSGAYPRKVTPYLNGEIGSALGVSTVGGLGYICNAPVLESMMLNLDGASTVNNLASRLGSSLLASTLQTLVDTLHFDDVAQPVLAEAGLQAWYPADGWPTGEVRANHAPHGTMIGDALNYSGRDEGDWQRAARPLFTTPDMRKAVRVDDLNGPAQQQRVLLRGIVPAEPCSLPRPTTPHVRFNACSAWLHDLFLLAIGHPDVRSATSLEYAFRMGETSLLSLQYTAADGGYKPKVGEPERNHAMDISFGYFATTIDALSLMLDESVALDNTSVQQLLAANGLRRPEMRFTHTLELPSTRAMADEKGRIEGSGSVKGSGSEVQRAAWQDEHTGLPYTPKSASSARGGHTTFLHLTADRSMDDLINVAFSSRSGWRNVSFSSETFVDYLTSHGRQHGGRALEVFSLYVASGQLKAPPHSLASHLMEAIGGAKGEKLDDPKLRARLVAVQQEIHEELNSTRTVAAFEAEYLSEPMRAARLKLHDQARSLEVGACWVCLTNVDADDATMAQRSRGATVVGAPLLFVCDTCGMMEHGTCGQPMLCHRPRTAFGCSRSGVHET